MLGISNFGHMEKSLKNFMEYDAKVISDDWEICPSNITVDNIMGEGAFGEVYRGYIEWPLSHSKVKPEYRNKVHICAAIKLLKGKVVFFLE